MNGSRTGGDVILGWDGFLEAVRATMSNYYLHNIVWYCDPDVMLLRTPLTLDQARAWATLQGLTGQALMASDRMPDLSEERVEILKRVFPALDIRPLDLFPSTINKKIWDLKISHLGRNYDVVGVFNFKQDNRENVLLKWSDLGLPENVPVHIFDFWNDEYLGAWESGIHLELSPTSCRVLTLIPDDGRIQLISTSRHIAQGTVDLLALTLDQKNLRCQGISKVIAGDRYELRFAYPRSQNYVISKATAGGLPVTITNHQGWGTVQFVSPASAEVSWQLTFESADRYHYPVNKVTNLSVGLKNLDGAELSWSSNYNLNAGYQVYVDNQLQGYTPVPRFPLAGLDPQKIYEVSVTTVWDNGMINESKRSMPLLISSLLPQQIDLSGITPNRATSGWGNIRSNVSVTGQPLTVDGDRFDRGIGTHADSDLEFPVNGLFGRFTAKVGIDDDVAEKKGSVEFSIVGDGKLLWKSEKMEKGDSPESIEVDISKVITLVLRVTSTGDGIDYDHADWLEPTLHRK
jgi:hypothetical protein